LNFLKEEIQVILNPIQEFHRGGVGREALNGSTIAAAFDLGLGLSLFTTDLKAKVGSGVARMEIKYKKALDGDSAIFKCKVLAVKKNLIYTEGILYDSNNQVCSIAKATLFVKSR
jgi:acyl-coenzyme A thioesterase PaaI-like protein